MPKKLIEVKDVWKLYEMENVKVPALQGLNVTVNKGDFLVIMGPSGSGKSTAMNMIGCLDRPTKGKVILDGEDIAHMSEGTLTRIRGRKIGFVFQKFNLINSLDAVENVGLPLLFQGVPEEERNERAHKLLESVHLGHRLHHRPTQMSGGEQQRVAIARALANDPEIILADEPTGNLDSKTGAEVMTMLRELHEKGNKTIILITHDVNLKRDHEKVVYLKDGKNVEHL
ncbi:putative ABC transporter ATP-binding protein [uncultured archaeon]|nr:putative ABC transporter ATP-binding protein [uncultured archaeon]